MQLKWHLAEASPPGHAALQDDRPYSRSRKEPRTLPHALQHAPVAAAAPRRRSRSGRCRCPTALPAPPPQRHTPAGRGGSWVCAHCAAAPTEPTEHYGVAAQQTGLAQGGPRGGAGCRTGSGCGSPCMGAHHLNPQQGTAGHTGPQAAPCVGPPTRLLSVMRFTAATGTRYSCRAGLGRGARGGGVQETNRRPAEVSCVARRLAGSAPQLRCPRRGAAQEAIA